jgi:hypothetical protein
MICERVVRNDRPYEDANFSQTVHATVGTECHSIRAPRGLDIVRRTYNSGRRPILAALCEDRIRVPVVFVFRSRTSLS